ncbi:peptide-methionine (S)-S-oxide reductase [Snuella sedimenti]|uniref:peptide-methionine (S)-S-oxide reductase n=1 Tax=Snuella sedimenti TaxID=2798802 RepID=A0A8J7LZ75_9FLAO|nr:peptide-methionine (S)-S-oxide reductase [Snuella sedimenti]MBJ6369761.1 peptide-methionine (S)-S-oxide reductase [Snuella sedimenti]
MIHKIGLGGGCHWCTEAVFQSLKGVEKVEQGYVSSVEEDAFSEAVIVHFNPDSIPLKVLIEVHLYTHKSTSNHSMRTKYRSGVYVFSKFQALTVEAIIDKFQYNFEKPLVTKVYTFKRFKASRSALLDYYNKNPKKPFCKTYINPKLKLLLDQFSEFVRVQRDAQIKVLE